MASGRFNTMAEGLQKVAADVTGMMVTPDADLDFLTELQTLILSKLREPWDSMSGGAAGPPPDAGQGQMPPEIAAMMGGQMPAGPVPMGGGPPMGPGPMPGASTPNPDELRRLMSM